MLFSNFPAVCLFYSETAMSLFHPTNLRCCTSSASASPIRRSTIAENGNTAVLSFEGTKERIKNMFNKVELSVSSYDTAWVAMVPSLNSPQNPFFPECLNWLLDNQHADGSWGLSNRDPLFIKDAILSTLASVLALKRWNVGQEQINKGLYFVESNLASATDDKQHSPVGFDIILPGMIEYATSLNLNFPIEPAKLDDMVHKRELKLKRALERNSEGDRAYLAYISEGMEKLQDWEMVMKFQRKNGSLFNSPSATAAAFTNFKNDGCLKYLCSVLEKFGNAVPTVYPLDTHARLCMVDSLERLGIDRHFREEIKTVLDETYRCWLQEEENIFLDPATCAMAFRILRLNGYDVSSEPLTQFSEDHIFNYLGGHMKDISTILELFRASQVIIHPNESILEKQNFWTSHFLKQELSNGSIMADKLNKYFGQEVTEALNFPFYANLERLSSRKAIEHYNIDSTRILKTSYSSLNIRNKDFLKLAVEDFNNCQSIQQKELQILARWIVENKLDKLNFARQKLAYCYFSAAATLFAPELYDARTSWAKNGVLTTVVDDFFDVGGSEEELLNLIQLVEKWDVDVTVECCSENVKIIFLALHGAISDIGAQASMWQGRDVKHHIIEIWLDLLKSMLKEAEWLQHKSTPTMDEYMTNGYVSFALGPIVLPALYMVGPKLSEEVVRHSEFRNLYKLMSTCGRLLNDIQSFKRESEEGKLNAVSLAMIQSKGNATEEECMEEMKSVISSKRRELLRIVLQEKGCVVPRACKDLFWKMSQVLHLFYAKDDGFTSHEMANAVNAVIGDPLVLTQS